jgi:hypothetical protein
MSGGHGDLFIWSGERDSEIALAAPAFQACDAGTVPATRPFMASSATNRNE